MNKVTLPKSGCVKIKSEYLQKIHMKMRMFEAYNMLKKCLHIYRI